MRWELKHGVSNRVEGSQISFKSAVLQFSSQTSPRLLAALFVVGIVSSVFFWSWSWWNLLVPIFFLAAQPFTEWTIHIVLLHFKPRNLGRLRIDPLVARKHRDHHFNPKDVSLVFIPIRTLCALVGGLALLMLLVLPASIALSGLTTTYAILLTYEWTHFLIHSSYRPQSGWYRRIWRAHRNHHYRNEHYWFGVTLHTADRVLGTYPALTTVELSPTARTLGSSVDH